MQVDIKTSKDEDQSSSSGLVQKMSLMCNLNSLGNDCLATAL